MNINDGPETSIPAPGDSGSASTPRRLGYIPIEGRSLALPDEKGLLVRRGFTPETLSCLRFFTCAEADMGPLGISIPFNALPSTVAIPYLREAQDDTFLVRVHKTSAEGLRYPPYLTPEPEQGSRDLVIAESEMKAAMAFQLGDVGVGLHGAQSFVNRVSELANALRAAGVKDRRVFLVPDHEYLIKGDARVVQDSMISMLRLAFALSLDLGIEVRVLLLPERFLAKGHTSGGQPKLKADLDAAVAAGLAQSEWGELKEQALTVPELKLPARALANAMALAAPNEFLAGEYLKARLKGMVLDDAMEVCKVVLAALRSRCWDPVSKQIDQAKLAAYLKIMLDWAKRNGLRFITMKSLRSVLKQAGGVLFSPENPKKGELIALCLEESERGVVLVNGEFATEVIAPFTLRACRYGNVHYVDGPAHRRYRVRVERVVAGRVRQSEIEIHGDLYDPSRYTVADADLAVADSRRWRMYVGEKLRQDGFQVHDPGLDTPLFVGLARAGKRLVAAAHVTFPRLDQDCWYSSVRFPESGDANTAFQEIATISRYNDVAFAHLLGSPLKAILGAFPHASWVGTRFAGKSTTREGIEKRTGLKHADASKQLSSGYRQLRVMGNHNLAIPLEEIARLDERMVGGLVAILNTAYNGAYCTHGYDGHYYVAGCAILIGQDRGFDDEALESKQIVINFAVEDLNQAALKSAKKICTPFPMAQWLQFLAEKSATAQERIGARTDFLRGALQARGVDCSKQDRHLFNYSAALVSADYLREFGVVLDIDAKVVDLCRLHAAGLLHSKDQHPAAMSIAERFLRDALEVIHVQQHRQRLAGTFDIRPCEGVWIKLTPVFDYLKGLKPNAYEVRNAARIGEAITAEFSTRGMIKRKHEFGSARSDAWLIPTAVCAQLGFELIEPQSGQGSTGVNGVD